MPEFGKRETPSEAEKPKEVKVDEHIFSDAVLPMLRLQERMSREEAIEMIVEERGLDKAAFTEWLADLPNRKVEPPKRTVVAQSVPPKTERGPRSKLTPEEIQGLWYNQEPMI